MFRALAYAFLAASALLAAPSYDVRQFGAKGDGSAKDTAAIQAAIDAAEKDGGGIVEFAAGRYLSGTIHLKNNITLHLVAGATLAASPDNVDFDPYENLPFQSVSDKETTYFHYALVAAENVHNIAILGQGAIDGNRSRRGGPKTIAIKLSQYIAIRGITVRNSPNYSVSFWGCDYVDVDAVTVENGFADGIDPDSCRFVRISNCFVDSADDAICPKTSPSMGMENRRPTEHLTVTNCVLSTNASDFKFGTESSGDFRNVAVSNCTILPRSHGRAAASGISLESVDGSNIDGVVISNIVMRGVRAPIFLRLGNRGRGLQPPQPGTLRNVSIQNIIATGFTMATSITGIPGHPVEGVAISGLRLVARGGNTDVRGLDVPEHEAKYPEGTMFGVLPAYALYVRHVEGLTLSGLHTRWDQPDNRPAVLFDDVRNLELDGLRAETAAEKSPVVWFNDVAGALLRGSASAPATPFLRLTGSRTKNVHLIGNDFTSTGQAIEFGPGIARSVVSAVANLPKD